MKLFNFCNNFFNMYIYVHENGSKPLLSSHKKSMKNPRYQVKPNIVKPYPYFSKVRMNFGGTNRFSSFTCLTLFKSTFNVVIMPPICACMMKCFKAKSFKKLFWTSRLGSRRLSHMIRHLENVLWWHGNTLLVIVMIYEIWRCNHTNTHH